MPLSAEAGGKKDKKHKKISAQQKYMQADLFAQAIVEREKQNYEQALVLIDKSLEIIPDEAAANYEKARLLLQLKRKDEAVKFAEKAMAADPSNKWYRVLHARLAKENNDVKTYVEDYEILVEEYPRDIEFLQELAFGYYYANDINKSIETFNRMEEIIGVNEGLTIQKAELYSSLGKNDKAVQEYEKLIDYNPNEERYYVLLAEYATKTKNIDLAIEAYHKVLKLDPDDEYAHISLADFYRQKGDNENSFKELKEGMKNKVLPLETKINILVSYYKGELNEKQKKETLELSEILKNVHPDDALAETFNASMLYENKKYEEARVLFAKIVESEPNNYGNREQLLFCHLYLNDYDKLLEDSEKTIEFFPSRAIPWFFAGISYYQKKDYESAIEKLEKGKDFVVNNNGLLEQFYSSLGDAYNEVGNKKASYDNYDKALKLNPENSVVLNNYAYYLSLENKNLKKAADMASKSVKLDPYNSSNLDTYGWVLFQQEKYEEALEWLTKAYRNDGDNSGTINEHLGDTYFKLGKTDKAMDYWKKAKELGEHSKLLEKKIKNKTFYE